MEEELEEEELQEEVEVQSQYDYLSKPETTQVEIFESHSRGDGGELSSRPKLNGVISTVLGSDHHFSPSKGT